MKIRRLFILIFVIMSMAGCAVSQGAYNNMVTYEPEMFNGRIDANVRLDVKHTMDSLSYNKWKAWGNPDSNIENWKNAIAEMVLKDFRSSGIFYRVIGASDYSPYDMEIQIETKDIIEGSEYFISANMYVYDPGTRAEISRHSIKRGGTMRDYKGMLRGVTGELKGILMDDYQQGLFNEAINRGRSNQLQTVSRPAPGAITPALIISAPTDEADNSAFTAAGITNSVEAWSAYLKTNPTGQHREEALINLSSLLVQKDDADQIASMAEEHPALADHLPLKYSQALIGPSGLTVAEVVEIKKQGLEDRLIVAQIRSTGAAYKKFSLQEIMELKEMGLSAEVIETMIDSTTEARKAETEAIYTRKLEADNLRQQAELDRIRNEHAALQRLPTPTAAPQPVAQQREEPNIVNCVAQATAIEVCNEAPGGFLGQAICKAAAKSSFPCK